MLQSCMQDSEIAVDVSDHAGESRAPGNRDVGYCYRKIVLSDPFASLGHHNVAIASDSARHVELGLRGGELTELTSSSPRGIAVDAAAETSRSGAGARREREHVQRSERKPLHETHRHCVIGFRLTGKSRNHVC